MGDRALVLFHDKDELSPVIYMHWGGDQVKELIEETRKLMQGRLGDVAYSAARFCGIAHNSFEGNLSLGIWNGPSDKYAEGYDKIREKEFSQGDAGVFLVDCTDFTVECFNGYGFEVEK